MGSFMQNLKKKTYFTAVVNANPTNHRFYVTNINVIYNLLNDTVSRLHKKILIVGIMNWRAF
jgi:hypothetical protein